MCFGFDVKCVAVSGVVSRECLRSEIHVVPGYLGGENKRAKAPDLPDLVLVALLSICLSSLKKRIYEEKTLASHSSNFDSNVLMVVTASQASAGRAAGRQ